MDNDLNCFCWTWNMKIAGDTESGNFNWIIEGRSQITVASWWAENCEKYVMYVDICFKKFDFKEVGKIETRRGCQGWMIMLQEEYDWCNECFCFILKVEINRTCFKDNTEDFGEKEYGLLYR